MKNSILLFASILCLGGMTLITAQSNPTQYKIANKFQVPGEGGWDYIACDESSGRLYISHGTVMQVIDAKDGKMIGTVPGTNGIHGIAIAKDLNKGYTSNGKDSSVTVFNLKTLAVLSKIDVTGQNPDAILYDPFTHQVFTFNGRSTNATVIDAKTDKVIETISLEGKPEFPVTDGKGKIFVNIEDKSTICQINAKTLIVEQTWPIAPGKEPSGLAIDVENSRLFAVCDNKLMMVIDAASGTVISSIPIGSHPDAAAFDPGTKRAYSSNGEGNITVVQEEKGAYIFNVIETVPTQKGARTMTIDIRNHHLYLPVAEDRKKPGSFVVLDVAPAK